jgi:hypothetical protein
MNVNGDPCGRGHCLVRDKIPLFGRRNCGVGLQWKIPIAVAGALLLFQPATVATQESAAFVLYLLLYTQCFLCLWFLYSDIL